MTGSRGELVDYPGVSGEDLSSRRDSSHKDSKAGGTLERWFQGRKRVFVAQAEKARTVLLSLPDQRQTRHSRGNAEDFPQGRRGAT